MHFHQCFLLAFLATILPLSTASPPRIIKRDGASVVNAVNTIATDLVTLNQTVSSYSGGIAGTITALQIQFETTKVEQDLKSAIKTTEQSSNFTQTESSDVATAFVNVEPKIISTLDNIILKKSAFETGLLGLFSLTELVKIDLEQQKELSAELGDAVVEKLTANYAALAPLINDQIAAKFEDAIEAYS